MNAELLPVTLRARLLVKDVAGSSLKKGDFVKAIGELARIYWTYLGPVARPDDATWSPNGRPLPDASSKSTRGDQRAA